MREILPTAAEWAREGRAFALATLVGVARSAPRELGAAMVVSADGQVFGNVSGGCVEGAVYELCLEAMSSGEPVLERYGISDESAFAIGLTCGGIIDVLVRPIAAGGAEAEELILAAEREHTGAASALGMVVSSPRGPGLLFALGADAETLDVPGLPPGLADDARSSIGTDSARILRYDEAGCRVEAEAVTSVLVVPLGAPARMIVVGAVEFSVALARLGLALGLAVTVVDAREVFATAERFPGAEVVVSWPDRYLATTRIDARTAICVLSHDPKFDVPALRVALASGAGYVGAMGSRRTHEDRLARLAQAGVPEASIARLRSPIGLELGGRSPEETALSILAEIVADNRGGSGRRLSELSGAVHPAAGRT
jgi:xanthine dehydrogenase accessory factor